MTQLEFLRIATATAATLWAIVAIIGVAIVWEFRRTCGFWKPLGEMVLFGVFGLAIGATTGVALDAVFPDLIQPQEIEPHRPSGRAIPGPTYTPTATATPTPEPDPCSECPDPASFSCLMWPMACYQCWEDCGQPIATPTPTPIPPPTATPTPHPDQCAFSQAGTWTVYLIAYYLHEDPHNIGFRYKAKSNTMTVTNQTLYPHAEGHPVALEWFAAPVGSEPASIKSCGEIPDPKFPKPSRIFADGFESGTTELWSMTVPTPLVTKAAKAAAYVSPSELSIAERILIWRFIRDRRFPDA